MQYFYDRATIGHALSLSNLPAPIRANMAALPDDLIDWTEYLIIEPGDTEQSMNNVIGFSPLVEAIDGARFGCPGFQPSWDWIGWRDGYFQAIYTFGSTFSYVLFVQDADDVLPDLLALCRAYA